MHTQYLHNGFLVLAIVFFLLNAFHYVFRGPSPSNEPRKTPNWDSLGFASVVLAFVLPFFI